MPESTSGRLLTLLSLLQARRDWPGEVLADRLGVSVRTIRRDVERLRGLGYPVESLTGPAGGYRLAAGTAMPPLLLDDDEAIAIAVGLRTAAGAAVTGIEETAVRALVKLEQVLPAHLRRQVGALQSAMATSSPTGPTVDPDVLAVLATACRDLTRVRFGYTGRDGEATRRDVEPHGLVHRGRRWYLVAWDVQRDAWRTFRLDRLTSPVGGGTRFTVRPIPGGDAAAYLAENIALAPSRYEVRLRLHATAESLEDRPGTQSAALVARDDGTCEYTTADDHLDWLVMRIGMLGVDFDLLDAPDEVRDRLLALRDRLVRATS